MIRRLFYASLATISFSLPVRSQSSDSPGETVLHSFQGGTGGGNVVAGLIQVNGLLYGTTLVGGTGCKTAGGCGTLFSVDPATHVTKLLHVFKGGTDGQEPFASLLRIGGKLYGTTAAGGNDSCSLHDSTGCGTVFSYDLTTGREEIVHAFVSGDKDGANAQSPLMRVNNTIYGNTIAGGPKNAGTVFAIDLSTKAERILHTFGKPGDGANPLGRLVLYNGLMFGTTTVSGRNKGGKQWGTLFSINPTSGEEKIVYAFQTEAGGYEPIGGVIVLGNKLYGTTYWGGNAEPYGTVYSVDPATGTETVVHGFTNFADGSSPYGGLIAVNGKLYGTTSLGGAHNGGTLFSVDPATGQHTLIYSFPGGTGGFNPEASLLHAGGHFYGTTVGQGDDKCTGACGTVFQFTP